METRTIPVIDTALFLLPARSFIFITCLFLLSACFLFGLLIIVYFKSADEQDDEDEDEEDGLDDEDDLDDEDEDDWYDEDEDDWDDLDDYDEDENENENENKDEDEDEDEEEEEEEDHGNRWFDDAPEDILSLIKTRLKFVDQILQFGAVCTRWNSADCIEQLPFMLGMQHDPWGGVRVCGLYDLYNQKKYMIHHQLIPPNGHRNFDVPEVFCSKRGWLFLLAMSTESYECKAILFHAFNFQTIHLPDLKIDRLNQSYMARGTFSTLPTFSDCVFYFAFISYHSETEDQIHGEIVLFTYRYGDETWKTVKLPTLPHGFEIRNMIYMNNLLYFTSFYGEILTFNIHHEEEEEDWVKIDIDCSAIDASDMYLIFKQVEYNGEMLWVGVSLYPLRTYRVYKIDWSRKAWVEQVTGLRNLVFFLGDYVSYALSVTSDYIHDEKIRSLEHKFYSRGSKLFAKPPYHGHARGLFFGCYHTMKRFLREDTEHIVWVTTR